MPIQPFTATEKAMDSFHNILVEIFNKQWTIEIRNGPCSVTI